MFYIALICGKLTYLLVKIFTKGGGSALPGLIALKIDSKLISKLASRITTNIVITGTNGKTTTSAMVAQILRSSKKVIHNSTGSNLSRGVASKLLVSSTIWGTVNAEVGIWEADEAAFVDIVEQIKPEHIVLLNIARDQLDRYGEINTILEKWKKALEKANWKKTVYLNADDGNIMELKNLENTTVQTFGLDNSPVKFEKDSKNPTYTVKAKILESSLNSTEFVFAASLTTPQVPKVVGHRMKLPIAGAYNVYNFLAAYLVCAHLEISVDNIVSATASYTPAFGRMEQVMFGETEGLIALIKNPAGATQVIHTITPILKKDDVIVIMLNDNIADGTDVSWIWDTDFENIAPHVSFVHVTGTRKYDMALRLYYAGVQKKSIQIRSQIPQLDSLVQNHKGRLFILSTYTALLELQRYLKEKGYKEKHWHE